MTTSLGPTTERGPGVPLEIADRSAGLRTLRYRVRGLAFEVASDLDDVLAVVDATYVAFRVDDDPADAPSAPGARFELVDLADDGACLVRTADGAATRHPTVAGGLIALLEAMVAAIVAGLHRQGFFAVHAAAVAAPRGAIVIVGRSGQGKSTLALGLVRRGLQLMSDELALLDPATGLVHPYRRSAHVRADTVSLIPELAPLTARPRHQLGGGNEWTVGPAEIAAMLGGRVGPASPLAGVILLDGAPDATRPPRVSDVSPAIAALELLRSTWAASVDFAGTLDAVGGMLSSVPCLGLSVGDLEQTVDAVSRRFELTRG